MKTRLPLKYAIVAILTLLSVGIGTVYAQTRGALELRLYNGLFQGDTWAPDSPTLLVDLRHDGELWDRPIGFAGDFNPNIHFGRVDRAIWTDKGLDLSLEMNVRADSYVPGGRAFYEVTLMKTEDGNYEGTYRGRFRGVDLTGRAEAFPRPDQPAPRTVTPADHPRLLFHPEDLPALREKAKTPFGKAALAKMGDEAASLALRYQLTSDKKYAQAARVTVEKHLADRENGSKLIRSRIWGWRLEQIALAYDMCYDAWPEDFRARVGDEVVYLANRLFFSHNQFHAEISWHMASTYPGTILYGTGLASLALWGEPGPAPERPVDPLAATGSASIAPPQGFKPGKGVPIWKFVSDQLPTDWIVATGFKVEGDEDPLKSLGGVAEARPVVGVQVSHRDREDTFQPLIAEAIYTHERYTAGRKMIDLTAAAQRAFHTTSFFYLALDNDKPRWVKVASASPNVRVYVDGKVVPDGQTVRLERGLYPLLVAAKMGETTPWGKILFEPRLTEVTEAEVAATNASIREEYEQRLKDWELETAIWEREGRPNSEYHRMHEVSHYLLTSAYREGIREGGYQGSTAFPMGLDGAVRYPAAYRNVFGVDASPFADISHYLPCKMFNLLFRPDGPPLAQDLNGTPFIMIDDVYHETRDLSLDFCASLFPVIPGQWQLSVLWAWNRWAGVTGEGDLARLFDTKTRPYSNEGYEAMPLYAFVNYPLDMKPLPPGKTMPLAWEAPGFGYYGFRSDWAHGDEFLTQVFAKSYACTAGRRENAGTLRVLGLGQVWSHGLGTATGERFGENVVQLLADEINRGACGRVTFANLEQDGSGVVTMNLDDVYTAPVPINADRNRDLYERNGGVRRNGAFADVGIRGLRSVGVDYSGQSGAPCLIVMVDKLSGGGAKAWTWQIESSRDSAGKAQVAAGDKNSLTWKGKTWPYRTGTLIKDESKRIEQDPTVDVAGNTFTLQRGAANLHATFVTPAKPQIEFAQRDRYTQTAKAGISRASSKAIFAEGGDNFFVMMTIQRGKPPTVHVEGSGLGATVKVGKQAIRFDGEKVVFGAGK